jgi:hypothetical protein
MDTLSFTSSLIGVISLAISIQRALLYRISDERPLEFVANDLPTLIAFLEDAKNSFLNSREQPPTAAVSALSSCMHYMDQLHHKLHKVYGSNFDRKMNGQQWARIQLGHKGIEKSYRSFRDAVLLLKDICLL